MSILFQVHIASVFIYSGMFVHRHQELEHDFLVYCVPRTLQRGSRRLQAQRRMR